MYIMIKKILAICYIFFLPGLILNSSSISLDQNYYNFNDLFLNDIIYVDDDNINGPWNGSLKYPYIKIQEAIDNSSNYDTIFVFDGIYYENLLIDKNIILTGINYNNTIIDGRLKNNTVTINSDNVKIDNFTIRNSGGFNDDAGISINSKYNEINDCVFYNTKNGIIQYETNFNIVTNCSFRKNGIAISSIKSFENKFENCSFDHNAIGINIDNSIENFILYCSFFDNGISSFINNSMKIQLIHCNISDNSVNMGGLFLISSEDIVIRNSNLNHNGVGIVISSSNLVNISYCDINYNTHFGISLRESSKNIKILKCEIKNNIRFGVYIEEDNQCDLTKNNIYNNLLFDLFSKNSFCRANNNWWGSKVGPINVNFEKKIKFRGGWIKLIPWEMNNIESIGSRWNSNDNYMNSKFFIINNFNINFLENDSDYDKIPDWWEEKWGYDPFVWDDHENLDPDNDALNNIQECYTDRWGSNPFYKDIFLEIDWMISYNSKISNKPSTELINEIIQSFKNHNITLHVDLGLLGGGKEIDDVCTPFLSFPKLVDIYFDNFLENKLNNPRKGIFHYGIICNKCPDINFPFYGWDQFDSFAISAQWLKDLIPLIKRSNLIAGAIIHHLGHTLKLHADIFNGIDNIETTNPFSSQWRYYKNYKSCMNYRYKYKILNFSDGNNGEGDFNDWINIDFDFFKNSTFKNNYNK